MMDVNEAILAQKNMDYDMNNLQNIDYHLVKKSLNLFERWVM